MRNHQKGSVLLRLLAIIGIVGGVIAIFAMETARYGELRRLRDRTTVLEQDVRTAQSKADAALSAVIEPETLAQAQKSVYLIVVNGSARGTAFVIDRERGLLATAAHTAASLPLDDPTSSVTILNRATRKGIRVTSVKLHAGFGAFRELVEDHQPIRGNSSIYSPQAVPLRDLAFDAGLITVDALDPETDENMLGPDLKIAAEDKLLALEAGAPIAVIGYPFDTLDDGFAPDSAISRVERGVIAAMTPPLDSVEENRDPVIANLIIHRLATAGGNSGSPVLNAVGDVVGIHTHGIVSPASNGDGAAQRAEVLYDLLDHDREESRLEKTFFPSWKRILKHWSRAEDALPWSFYMEYARPGEEPAPLVRVLTAIDPLPFDRVVERLTFEPESENRVVDASDVKGATPTSGNNENTIAKNGSSFLIKSSGQYAEVWRTVDRSRDHVLFAFDYSLRSTRGFCPLSAYYRKKGETRLRIMKSRASFELYLPADGNAVEDYQIVLRRNPKCDPLSDEFFVASVSWPTTTSPTQTVAYAPISSSTATEGEPNGLLNHLRTSFHSLIKCRKPGSGQNEECQTPEYIELE